MVEKKIPRRINKKIETDNGIDRRSEIYKKALDLFILKGYDATSLSMIAKHVGMSKANLYYYCPSKEGLLYQIHLNDLERRFIPILNEADKIHDPQDRLIFFLKKFVLMCTSSAGSRVFVHEIGKLKKSHQKEIKIIWRRAYQLLCGAIGELQESGRAPKLRKSFLAFLGVGMVFWIIYWWDYRRQADAEELAETLAHLFLNGLVYPASQKY